MQEDIPPTFDIIKPLNVLYVLFYSLTFCEQYCTHVVLAFSELEFNFKGYKQVLLSKHLLSLVIKFYPREKYAY